MKHKKLFFMIIGIVVFVAIVVGAAIILSANAQGGLPALLPADNSAYASSDANTPEALAKKSSDTYRNMVNGDLSAEDGFNIILSMTTAASMDQMKSMESEFASQISDTRDYLASNNDSITGYEFTKTEYKSETAATIMRIQNHKNGKKYYFQQDFILENGQWKVKGDNIADPFRIKSPFLWWFI